MLSPACGRRSSAIGTEDRPCARIQASPPLKAREVKTKASEKRAADDSTVGGRRKSGERQSGPSAGGLCAVERGTKGKGVENSSGQAKGRPGRGAPSLRRKGGRGGGGGAEAGGGGGGHRRSGGRGGAEVAGREGDGERRGQRGGAESAEEGGAKCRRSDENWGGEPDDDAGTENDCEDPDSAYVDAMEQIWAEAEAWVDAEAQVCVSNACGRGAPSCF